MLNNREKFYYGSHHRKSIINQIMLGFQPIAPKPISTHHASSGPGDGMHADKLTPIEGKSSSKRKYVRVKKTSSSIECKKNKKTLVEDQEIKNETSALTLQLLTGRLVVHGVQKIDQVTTTKVVQENQTTPNKFSLNETRTVELWVIVESLTHTCMDFGVLGETDQEKMRTLEVDTCLGVVSDGCSRVQWVNDAYKSMVMRGDENKPLKLSVGFLMKENMEFLSRVVVFTCKVKLHYSWQNGKFSQMVPCDVWRMDFGGFAWRLDVKAAFKLGW